MSWLQLFRTLNDRDLTGVDYMISDNLRGSLNTIHRQINTN
ncbi:MAG: hypothetical protein JXB48_16670 [Candidatus Latescibacteria bacterium]|nr:hypothetical protein [Candidatus Latescibacterota bacterium]